MPQPYSRCNSLWMHFPANFLKGLSPSLPQNTARGLACRIHRPSLPFALKTNATSYVAVSRAGKLLQVPQAQFHKPGTVTTVLRTLAQMALISRPLLWLPSQQRCLHMELLLSLPEPRWETTAPEQDMQGVLGTYSPEGCNRGRQGQSEAPTLLLCMWYPKHLVCWKDSMLKSWNPTINTTICRHKSAECQANEETGKGSQLASNPKPAPGPHLPPAPPCWPSNGQLVKTIICET